MCNILEAKNNTAYNFAVDLGIAFQLTNIARDITSDAKLGRIYIPKSWLKIEPDQVLNISKKNKIKVNVATKKLLDLADLYYSSAILGLRFLPHRSRISVLIALSVYRKIGIKIKNNNYDSLDRRQTVSFGEKLYIAFSMIIIYPFYNIIHNNNYKHNRKLHTLLKKSIL